MFQPASRLGVTSSVWPTAATRWVGPPPGATLLYDTAGNYAGWDPIDSKTGKPIVDIRPIAEPSAFWGGEGGRPLYYIVDGTDYRPDLYRYDHDGVEVSQTGGTGLSAGGGIVPILPADTKRAGTLNPPYEMSLTGAGGLSASASGTGLTTAQRSAVKTIALVLLGGKVLSMLSRSARR